MPRMLGLVFFAALFLVVAAGGHTYAGASGDSSPSFQNFKGGNDGLAGLLKTAYKKSSSDSKMTSGTKKSKSSTLANKGKSSKSSFASKKSSKKAGTLKSKSYKKKAQNKVRTARKTTKKI